MTLIRPVLKAIVRKPRSEDPTEVGVLTALSGELFQVATIDSIAGFKGYLEFPDGRQGKLNLKDRKTDVGQMTFRVLDRQLTSGGSQALRWVSGFPGGIAADGRTRWLGCQWETQYSSDGGVTFIPWFTGRIANVQVEANWVEFVIQGKTRDFVEAECFVGRPHASVAYVAETSLIPVGIAADYGTYKAAPPLAGTFGNASNGTGKSIAVTSDSISHPRNIITRTFRQSDGRQFLVPRGQTTTMRTFSRDSEIRCRLTHAGGSGDVRILGYKMYHRPEGHYALSEIWVEALNPTDANYVAFPANGTAVTWRVAQALREPSAAAPLLLGDVHPLQLAADLLDGKFSFLNADGSIRRAYARDNATWAAMIADQSWGTLRFRIDKKEKLLNFIETQLGKVCGFALREDAQGRVIPVDLRLPSSLAGIPTLTDDDLEESTPVQWGEALEDSFSRFQVKYYIDDVLTPDDLTDLGGFFPDVAACLIESIEAEPPYEERYLEGENEDAGIRTLTIDAKGLRVSPNELADLLALARGGTTSIDAIEGRCRDLLRQYEKPYATGAKTLKWTSRRTATAESLQVGGLALTAFSTQMNPAINARGGTLLGRIVEKRERGGKIEFQSIFLGPGVICGTPTIGAVVAGPDAMHQISIPVTLHPDGSPVLVRVALTEKAVGVRPADASPLWVTRIAGITVNGSYIVSNLPGGKRAWVQGRSEPKTGGKSSSLPSPWTNAAGAGYFDLTDVPAAASIAVSGVSQKMATLTLNLGGNTTYGVRILIGSGASKAVADASVPVVLVNLLPGTVTYTIYGLDAIGLNWWHRVQVQLFDSFGGVSSVVGLAATSFQATGANTKALRPAGVQLLAGTPVAPPMLAAIANPRDGAVGQFERSGIAATILPGQLGLDIVCRLAPDVAGAPGAWAEVDQIPGSVITSEGYTWSVELPADEVFRHISFLHRGVGFDDSDPTAPIRVKPGPLPQQGLPFLAQGPIATDRQIAGGVRGVGALQTYLGPNLEFDLWESDGVTPVGWDVDLTGGATVAKAAPADVNSGDFALKYSNPDLGTNGGWHGLSTNDVLKGPFCMPLRPGSKVRLLCKSMASTVGNAEAFRLTLDFGAGGTLQKTFIYQSWGHVAADYGELFEFPVDVPDTADPNAKLTIEFNRGTGIAPTDFWIDSIRADEETADYERLSTQISDQGYGFGINGDFEKGLSQWESQWPFVGGAAAILLDTVSAPVAKGTKAFRVRVTAGPIDPSIRQCNRLTDEPVNYGSPGWPDSTIQAKRVRAGDVIQVRGMVQVSAGSAVPKLGLLTWGGAVPAGLGTQVVICAATAASVGAYEELNGLYIVPVGVTWVSPRFSVSAQTPGVTAYFDDLEWGRLMRQFGVKAHWANTGGGGLAANNNTLTPISLDTEIWDEGGFHSTVANLSRLTIPNISGSFDGTLDIAAQVTFASNANGYRRLRVLKNGATVLAVFEIPAINGAVHSVQIVAQDRNPTPGDYYEIEAFQNSGANLAISTGADLTWATLAYRR